jgi:phosphoribosylanthranilate isomerase
MARIKICGLMREQDIDAVNTALPDYIGFVFAKSKRQIDEAAAISLKNLLHPAIKAVGVFVNEDIGKIIRLCNLRVIDLIQLHGDENEDYIKRLKNHVPNKIIKAVRVRSLDDVERAVDFSSDHLLFDAYHEGIYGGLGKTFDWSVVHGVRKPFFLAGGINSDNVAQAIVQCNPYCVDVSSGVETNGYKDPGKIKEIVAKVKQLL